MRSLFCGYSTGQLTLTLPVGPLENRIHSKCTFLLWEKAKKQVVKGCKMCRQLPEVENSSYPRAHKKQGQLSHNLKELNVANNL